jgi:hypothetical protein
MHIPSTILVPCDELHERHFLPSEEGALFLRLPGLQALQTGVTVGETGVLGV